MSDFAKFTSLINYKTEKTNSIVLWNNEFLLKRTNKSKTKYIIRLIRIENAHICVTKYFGKKFQFNIHIQLCNKRTAYESIQWALECVNESDIEANYKAIKELSYRLFGMI